ncbi:HCP-like protein [Coniophora puteana RWD-64-598 SS2]|uniref:HCP-like protein n=1 Tax=Coniophora puteana (strain RWD-64-598) TaxID=741705 RepID=A0A5M3MHR5_CONPW|nr:HCP-like protein [Coniophora puteana RWD-64-598 SS2]EIW78742.1 HCP-like protein [Coniophora puteana RWD-64-598 SS2]
MSHLPIPPPPNHPPQPHAPPPPPEFLIDPGPSQPHFEQPLVAPRPHKLDPDLPANMARQLDSQLAAHQSYRTLSPRPPVNPNPGFVNPAAVQYQPTHSPSPRSSSIGPAGGWALPATPRPHPQGQHPSSQPQYRNSVAASSLSPQMSAVSLGPPQPHHPRASSMYSQYPPSPAQSPPAMHQTAPPASLTAPLPTPQSLASALPVVQQPTHDPSFKVNWARDVLMLVDRSQQNPSAEIPVGPVEIHDPQLLRLSQAAVSMIIQIADTQPLPSPTPTHIAEAIYLKATLEASGAYPDHVPHNPRMAFRDFEKSARAGFPLAWFRLGRDYENFNDFAHARDCFERGLKANVESCIYRLGMANLMGQLGLPVAYDAAIPLLHRAATLASIQVPQPAYVYGLLLLGEFSHVTVPDQYFGPFIPRGSSLELEARKHIERAAYLNFAPAQYKLGHAYEFAQSPFPFDALLSVQYYSLASQQGEIEADMALSKWFLCGAEGSFDKDEGLAFTFAEKAARKGLASAEFAMGYYAEVGVGGSKDLVAAQEWYEKASIHGNTDATDRLAALSQPDAQALSRSEHDNLTESKLVRKRTQAKQRSEQVGGPAAPRASTEDTQQVVDLVRKNSRARQPRVTAAAGGPGSLAPVNEQAGAGQRQFPNQHRFTLVDPGSNPGTPPPGQSPPHRGGRPGGPQRVPSGTGSLPTPQPDQGAPLGGSAGGKKHAPQTFADMGITTTKLEEKECVIM